MAAILIVAGVLRLMGLDWDQGQHIHPDERLLTTIETALRWPSANFVAAYFDEATSPLNPRNVDRTFFVGGDLPVVVVKGIALAVGRSGYDEVYLVGRAVDGLVDVATVGAIYLVGRRAYGDRRVALLGSALYAFSGLAIQQAHLFVVDVFAVFFTTVALYWVIRVFQVGRTRDYVLAGGCGGLAIASKISVYPILGLIVVVAACRLGVLWGTQRAGRGAHVEQTLVRLMFAALAAYIAFRIGEPYAFQTPGLTSLAPRWLDDLLEARAQVSGERDALIAYQWANRLPLVFPLTNMVVWGLGLPLGLSAMAGWAFAGWQLVRRAVWPHLVPVTWTALLFPLLGGQWVASMPDYLPIYPTLVLLAAWFLVWIVDHANDRTSPLARLRVIRWPAASAGRLLVPAVVVATSVYAVGFASIYTRPHTQVAASRWIYANVPPGSVITNEAQGNEALPLRVDGKDGFAEGMYIGLDLDITADESPEKLAHVLDVLDQTEYLFISSSRRFDALARMPVRFPLATRFYAALFDGQVGFQRVAEFTSYPRFLFMPLADQGAEAAWTTYDHPRVQIFRKASEYNRATVEQALAGVNWSAIVRLTAKDATNLPNALMLTPDEQRAATLNGTWRDLFDPDSLTNRWPLAAWALALVLLGVLVTPYVWLAAAALPDRGFALAPPLGLLLVAWSSWWLASLHLVPFSRGGIWLSILVLGIGATAIAIVQHAAFVAWLRRARALLLFETVLFFSAFGLSVAVRSTNPDLWHPVLGGEKPMDFALLNAVTRSSFFPPYDPWFAGGFINYYYYGFVLVATLIHLTGIVPAVAYNLAIATWFAFLVLPAFGVVLGLVGGISARGHPAVGRRAVLSAALGAVFVSVIGNLAEVMLVLEALQARSNLAFHSVIPGLEPLVKSAHGLITRGFAGTSLPVRPEWWYWNATRIISHPSTEPGPITEFPWFTFLFGDLHPHLLALPYTVVALGLAVALIRQTSSRTLRDRLASVGHVLLLALVVGSLWPLNTWDLPTYALVAAFGFALRAWHRYGRISSRMLLEVLAGSAAVMLLGYLAFIPFHQSSASPVSGIEAWTGSRTPLHDYLTLNGFFLFVIGTGMVADLWLARDLNPTARFLRLCLRYWYRPGRLRSLHRRLVRPTGIDVAGRLLLAGGLVVSLGLWAVDLRGQALASALLLLGLLLLVRRPRGATPSAHAPSSALWQLTLGLACLGLALTLAVEFVVLKGADIGRMNTVFKFYLQAWVLFAIAAAGALPRVLQAVRRLGRGWLRTWQSAFALLFAATLLYPVLATVTRAQDRFDTSVGPTLDGMAFMQGAVYSRGDDHLTLAYDADAIRWVQATVAGAPVFAEMNTAPDLYTWGDRFATFTGNPVVVGWDAHERLRRGLVPGDLVDRRVEDIQAAYRSPDASSAYRTLEWYSVRYVVVGELEQLYAPTGDAKWAAEEGRLWDLVYQNPGVRIFRLRHDALASPASD